MTVEAPPAPKTFALRPVAVVALGSAAVLLALSPWYGYHRDELYFRLLGQRLKLGYFDTPPLTPMIARVSTEIFGDNLVALRVVPALYTAVVILLIGLITRELGGGRTAQLLAAAGTATSAAVLVFGHSLLTAGPDLAFWLAAILFALRALRRGDGRWWIAVGVTAGLATYNRDLIALLMVALGAGVVAVGPRSVLRDRYLWLGALVALVLALPNILWQFGHGWPELQMSQALKIDEGDDNRVAFVPLQLVLVGIPQAVVMVAGWRRLWRDRTVRAFAIAYPVAAVLVLYAGGRADYTVGLLLLMYAAGCVSAAEWRRRGLFVGLLALGALGQLLIGLPLIPASALASTPVPSLNEVARESVGWDRFEDQVAAVYATLPAGRVLITENYGEAGAENRRGLGPVYSGHNELYWWGPPPETARIALIVTDSPQAYRRWFAQCEERGRIDNGVGVDNEEQGLAITVCRDPIAPWTSIWPNWRHYS
ncbi:glycosyltransferase family 39 protein [Streptosporangiaceae bacterium NEAU-GS5]|nr:glycosyltransferase family 39 protein [Streptosporangiaceae bacterium NEAU-GS5]